MGSLILQPDYTPSPSFCFRYSQRGCSSCSFSLQIPCILTAEQLQGALPAPSVYTDPRPSKGSSASTPVVLTLQLHQSPWRAC